MLISVYLKEADKSDILDINFPECFLFSLVMLNKRASKWLPKSRLIRKNKLSWNIRKRALLRDFHTFLWTFFSVNLKLRIYCGSFPALSKYKLEPVLDMIVHTYLHIYLYITSFISLDMVWVYYLCLWSLMFCCAVVKMNGHYS